MNHRFINNKRLQQRHNSLQGDYLRGILVIQWHGDHAKRKLTGGKRKNYKAKRSFELGGEPSLTEHGTYQKKLVRGHGNTRKIKLLNVEHSNVTDPRSGTTVRSQILRVLRNPVNIDYNRRKIITKSTIIETELGPAIVTSRPGQDGVINSTLVT
jgi:small subunit ribosomal protein S8e